MTQAVASILQQVERLSPTERTDLRQALMAQISPGEQELTDDDFAALAAESFRMLDEEEAGNAVRRHGS